MRINEHDKKTTATPQNKSDSLETVPEEKNHAESIRVMGPPPKTRGLKELAVSRCIMTNLQHDHLLWKCK